ncbi:MAG: MoaD/ThiS family protein [Deltaproteobacteria bacterium]|nr:MoaD/ThiS family protein [Deltaproteobacteria bacterium]
MVSDVLNYFKSFADTSRMQISAKLFSMFRHYAGVDQVTIDLESGATVTDLLDALAGRFNNPAFKNDETQLMLMINNENAPLQTVLKEGDVVHLLPILGGG